jgi:gliding motility-associated-like protein
MKHLIYLGVVLAFFWGKGRAQNLVSNPDFDQYLQCPPYLGQIHQAIDWDSPNFATSDYFHVCSDSANGNGVPANRLGWQMPVAGSGYAGIRLWIPPGQSTPNQREYLITTLVQPLQQDSLYHIRFFASLADFSTHTTDALGVGLTDTLIGEARFLPFEPVAQLAQGAYLTDRKQWTPIEATYRAKGREQHLIIGNFRSDSEMALIPSLPLSSEEVLAVYVFIDQVSVTLVPTQDDTTSSGEESDSLDCQGLGQFAVQTLDTTLCRGREWAFSGPPGAVRYRWTSGDSSRFRLLTGPAAYQLTSFLGCDTLLQKIEIDVKDCQCGLFPQTVFSPNGDGLNDQFDLQLALGVEQVQWMVMDRWGRKVFHANHPNSHWDGITAGKPAPVGAYFWWLSYRCLAGGEYLYQQHSGTITLLR